MAADGGDGGGGKTIDWSQVKPFKAPAAPAPRYRIGGTPYHPVLFRQGPTLTFTPFDAGASRDWMRDEAFAGIFNVARAKWDDSPVSSITIAPCGDSWKVTFEGPPAPAPGQK